MLKKVFALVRIVHHKDPLSVTFEELCELYGEANWFIHMQAEIIAEGIAKRLNG